MTLGHAPHLAARARGGCRIALHISTRCPQLPSRQGSARSPSLFPYGFTDTVFIDKVSRERYGGRARVTLAEVASRCGVSRMTVSNAYNRPDQLSAELRQRVLATAEELGYGGPSAAGRALKRGRSDVLGVLLTEALPYAFGDPGTVSFLHGVTAETAAAGLALQLIPAPAGTAERLVRDAAVDGLIAHTPADGDPALAAALRRRLPTVINGGPSTAGPDCVTIDNESAAASAARHLIELGHRRLGIVTWRLHPDGYTRVGQPGPAGQRPVRGVPAAAAGLSAGRGGGGTPRHGRTGVGAARPQRRRRPRRGARPAHPPWRRASHRGPGQHRRAGAGSTASGPRTWT